MGSQQVAYGSGVSGITANAVACAVAAEIDVVRFTVDLAADNPASNQLFLSDTKDVVDKYEAAGIKVILCLEGAPQWVTGQDDWFYVPVSGGVVDQTYKNYVANTLATYISTYGTRVYGYQVQNEVNAVGFWNENGDQSSDPRPDIYRQVFNAAYAAGKAANPNVRIGNGGITALTHYFGPGAVLGVDYIPALISDGMTKPDFLAIHPYTGDSATPDPRVDNYPNGNSFADVGRIQAVMAASGWGDVPLWITEFGYYSKSGIGSDLKKAVYLAAALQMADKRYCAPFVHQAPVEVCCYFMLNNASNDTADLSDKGLFTGTPRTGPNTMLPAGLAMKTFLAG